MRIIIPDPIDIPAQQLEAIKALGVVAFDQMPTDEDELIKRISGAEAITANYVDITSKVMDATPSLKFIISPAVGYDWIDAAYAQRKGIQIINCPTHNSQAVAEHAIALLLTLLRKIQPAAADLARGGWNPKQFVGVEVCGKKLSLVGHGKIGTKIDNLATGLGMQVRYCDSKSSDKQIDDMLLWADIVCLCAPLTPKTRHIIDKKRFMTLKQKYLVNVSRGALVDQSALLLALQDGSLTGAALDVFENEPLTGEVDEQIKALANLPNVIATPHIAYNTAESSTRLGEELFANIKACLEDKPTNTVLILNGN